MAAERGSDGRPEDPDHAQAIAEVEDQISRLEALNAALQRRALDLLLPLGTPVELGIEADGSRMFQPAPGTQGVVVGYEIHDTIPDRVLVVAMPKDVVDHDGNRIDLPARHVPTVRCRRDEIRAILGEARLADGTANPLPGFVPTHATPDGKPVMAVATSDGPWLIGESEGLPVPMRTGDVGDPLAGLTPLGDRR